jgi:hypothetical protein
MTELMERHSKEVDDLMAANKTREDEHLKVGKQTGRWGCALAVCECVL